MAPTVTGMIMNKDQNPQLNQASKLCNYWELTVVIFRNAGAVEV